MKIVEGGCRVPLGAFAEMRNDQIFLRALLLSLDGKKVSYVEGFGELFRWVSYEEIASSTIQSRVTAGVANGTYIFCLPGSSGACRTGWDRILSTQLDIRNSPCNFAELLPRLTEK